MSKNLSKCHIGDIALSGDFKDHQIFPGAAYKNIVKSHSKVGIARGCEFEDHCTIPVCDRCES